MKFYRHVGDDEPGVTGYEIGPDFIVVRFRRGDRYLYNYKIPGRDDVERMKKLAVAGRGLSTFISRHIRTRYAEKPD